MKRVAFKTVGCRLNQAETARLAAAFEAAGYRLVPFGAACDVCVIHTCAITRRAEQKCRQYARAARRAHPAARLVLAGCAVDVLGPELRRQTEADLLAGRADKFRLPQLLDPQPATAARPPAGSDPLPRFDATRALLAVQDGCDFRCAYCVVPAARGPSRSRPFAAVLDEARRLSEAGYRELVLTGANLGCYADGSRRLVDLIAAIEALPDVARIRLSSIECTTVERPVLDYMAASAKLCHYLHLPLQSGDDGILRAMGRRYTAAQYRDVAAYAAQRVPRLGLGTDVLVGFPGETDAAFANTERLVRELPFSNLHVFPYSRRPGTPAADLPDQVPARLKQERAARLLALGREQRAAFAEGFVGRTVAALIERVDARGCARGWTGERLEARLRAAGVERNRIVAFVPARAEDGILYG